MPLSMAHIITLPTRSPSRLALEVQDMILDNLQDSKQDLSSYSLVCKSWLPLCRRHLFVEVNYRPELAKLITSSAHATMTISPHIRKVTIKGNAKVTSEMDIGTDFIFNLPNLQSLRIEKSIWDSLRSPIPLQSISNPSFWLQISTLDLRSIHFPHFSELVAVVESFPVLQDLSLDNVSWDSLGYISDRKEMLRDPAILKPSPQKKLHIAFCHNMVILNWLQYGVISDSRFEKTTVRKAHRSFPHLAVLSLPDIQPTEAYALGNFLVAVSETLERLEIGVLSNPGPEGFSNELDMSSNSRLKTLVIHQVTLFQFPFLVEHDPVNSLNPTVAKSPYSWIPTFVSTIQSNRILSIEFHMWMSDQSQLDVFPWSRLCDVLVNVGTPQIRLWISGIGRDTVSVKGWVIDRLAGIDKAKTAIEFEFIG